MIVGGPERANILGSKRSDVAKRSAAPTEGLASKLRNEKIGHQSGMTAVPIGKGVDGNEPVMKPNRNLVGPEGAVLGPVSRVAEQATQLDMDLLRIDTDILARLPRGPRPCPNIPEHPLVQLEDETFSQDTGAAVATSPGDRIVDIRLLRFIEVGACRDPRLPQPFTFFGIEGCCVVGLSKDVAHADSQRSRSRTAVSI